MPRDQETLLDIDRAARLAIEFTTEMDFGQFAKDAKTIAAVLHELMVIGEAAKRLSPEFRSSAKQVPWTEIAGMRDRLIHHYEEVDLHVVWQTVQRDLPDLRRMINAM